MLHTQKSMPRTLTLYLMLIAITFGFTACHSGTPATSKPVPGASFTTMSTSTNFSKDVSLVRTPNGPLIVEAKARLARYTQNDEMPEWENKSDGWNSLCDLHLNSSCSSTTTRSVITPEDRIVANLQAPPQHHGKSAHDIPSSLNVFQSIYYNGAATSWITSNHLNSPSTYTKLLAEAPTSTLRTVPEPTAIGTTHTPGQDPSNLMVVVKTEWQVVHPFTTADTPYPGPGKYGYLFLVNTNDVINGKAQSNGVALQETYVDATNPADKACHHEANIGPAAVYSLSCFFWRPLHPSDFQPGALPPDVISDMRAPACSNDTCYLILIGIHLISNETPTWTWRTYWWTSAKSDLQWNSDGTLAGNRWSFFDANAVTNTTNSVANPYLEGPFAKGMQSNCQNCHSYAAFSAKEDPISILSLENGKPVPLPPGNADYFKNSVQTHFLWSLAFNALSQQHPASSKMPHPVHSSPHPHPTQP